MGCEVEFDPKFFNGAQVIWCGDGIGVPPPPCEFCSSPSLYLCNWVGPKEVKVKVEEIEVGDVWITQQKQHRGRVVSIEPLDINNRVVKTAEFPPLILRFWIQLPGKVPSYPIERWAQGDRRQPTTERIATCDRPACEAHVREVDDEKHYCRAHWLAWSEAA